MESNNQNNTSSNWGLVTGVVKILKPSNQAANAGNILPTMETKAVEPMKATTEEMADKCINDALRGVPQKELIEYEVREAMLRKLNETKFSEEDYTKVVKVIANNAVIDATVKEMLEGKEKIFGNGDIKFIKSKVFKASEKKGDFSNATVEEIAKNICVAYEIVKATKQENTSFTKKKIEILVDKVRKAAKEDFSGENIGKKAKQAVRIAKQTLGYKEPEFTQEEAHKYHNIVNRDEVRTANNLPPPENGRKSSVLNPGSYSNNYSPKNEAEMDILLADLGGNLSSELLPKTQDPKVRKVDGQSHADKLMQKRTEFNVDKGSGGREL